MSDRPQEAPLVDEALSRARRRLERARRLLVVCGAGFNPETGRGRGAQVLGEMARFFEEVLLLDEEQGHARWEGRSGRREGDGASLSARFLIGGADLGLATGARLDTPESAGAWAGAWRAGAWLVEIGPPSELAVLAKESLRGEPDVLLDALWEGFLLRKGQA